MGDKIVKADKCNANVMRELLRMKFDDHRQTITEWQGFTKSAQVNLFKPLQKK